MKQLTKELKSVFTTGYNLWPNVKTEYRIQYWFLTHSDTYSCIIWDADTLLCKIKYGDKKDRDNYIRYTNDKNTKSTIKRMYKKYA